MAKAKWPKLPSYSVPLFNSGRIYLCKTMDEFGEVMNFVGLNSDSVNSLNGLCRHFENETSGENIYVIGVFNGSESTLVHECAHAAFFICHDFGVKIESTAANETYCYMIDRMFSYFLPYLKQE